MKRLHRIAEPLSILPDHVEKYIRAHLSVGTHTEAGYKRGFFYQHLPIFKYYPLIDTLYMTRERRHRVENGVLPYYYRVTYFSSTTSYREPYQGDLTRYVQILEEGANPYA